MLCHSPCNIGAQRDQAVLRLACTGVPCKAAFLPRAVHAAAGHARLAVTLRCRQSIVQLHRPDGSQGLPLRQTPCTHATKASGSSGNSGSSSNNTASTTQSAAAPPAAAKKKTIFPKGAHQREFRVWLDREKGNKVVTRIVEVNGWRLPPGKEEHLRDMSKALKQKCGAGGAVKMDTWEVLVQGDHRAAVLKALVEWGHAAKKAGG